MSKLLSKFKRNTIDEFINSVDNQKVSALAVSAAGTGYVNAETVSLFGGTTFTARHVLGADQVQADEAMYLSHVEVLLRY